MKGESYVDTVVRTYRAAIDGMMPTTAQKTRLRKVFDRGGYTDGYITGLKKDMYMKKLKNPYTGHEGEKTEGEHEH